MSNNEYITSNAKGLHTSWYAHDRNTRFFTHNWNVDAIWTAKQRVIFESNALVKWKEIKRVSGLIKLSINKICLKKSHVSWNRSFVLCRHEWIKYIFSEEQWANVQRLTLILRKKWLNKNFACNLIKKNQLDATITILESPRSAQHISGNLLPIFRSVRLRFLQHMV